MQSFEDVVDMRTLLDISVACIDCGGVIRVDVSVFVGVGVCCDDVIKIVWVGVVLDALESNESWCSTCLLVFVRVDVDDELDNVLVEFDKSEVIFILVFYTYL